MARWAPAWRSQRRRRSLRRPRRSLRSPDEAGVDRVVIVPPSWEGERNDYALEAARKYPNRFGVMGRILLGSKQSPGLLATWRDQPGMLGVRHTFNGAQTSWLTDGTADWFWPAAAKAGIPVMTPTVGRAPACC